jgi:predicted dehydrogenase
MLKIAIIGCGKIADDHASQIQRIGGCEIVAVCDREPLMARQLSERFPVTRYYSDVTELLADARPDVVHITTPPQSHFDIASRCLQSGCHVYVEKPFTLTAKDAETLIGMAEERGLKLTVGHDDQFTHVARRMRALVGNGYLGASPVHMESLFCYDLSDPAYARALFSDKQHWVRTLPGKLLQNIISHGVARIAEHLTTDTPHVIAHGFTSPLLKSLGETEIVDELRVIISEEERTTAYFTFSSQMRPSIRQFRIFGSRNGLLLDQDHEILLRLHGKRLKSYAEKFLPPITAVSQLVGNVTTNARLFLANDFHFKAGMKHLIESFYRSIVQRTSVPIPYREILCTARIMDGIFHQIYAQQELDRIGQTWVPSEWKQNCIQI